MQQKIHYFLAILFAGVAVAVAAPDEKAALCGCLTDALFCIGTPDGSTMEFGLTDKLWSEYAKRYPRDITFSIGKSKVAAWPYIHPSTHDAWAGGKPHTFTIRYHAERAPAGPLYLTIGALAIWEPSQITITVNGKQIVSRRLPSDNLNVKLAHNPDGVSKSLPLMFALPEGAIKAGDNTIGINLNDGSWIIYDYVLLSPRNETPKIAAEPQRELLKDALAGPMAGVEDVVFAIRRSMPEHWYANFSYYATDDGKSDRCDSRKTYLEGGKLCRLNLRTGKVITLLDDPKGGVRDPQVHYDGKKIVFSYRKGESGHYHLYEINADGSGLRQLTDDGPYDDLEPSYFPDGGIVFVSSRCKRWVNCWLTQVAVLYRCNSDGGDVRPISSNNEHDNTPWPLPDGRVLYTRWEYVDRSQVHYHHLWTVNPDGTSQSVYFGNLNPGVVMIDSKPVPESDKIVSIFSPGHGRTEHEGQLCLVDPAAGPDDPAFVKHISKGENFRDPWAFSEDCFLATRRDSIVLMNSRGQTQELFKLPDAESRDGFFCHEPRPLKARPREVVIAPKLQLDKTTGRMILANVYDGRNMDGVKPGEIKKLLVLESLPKPINYTGGMDPLTYGGSFTLERIVGTVPVEPDGSAYFEVPALRSLIFVALDENDLSVKRMQSFVTVQPGETTSCVGCHEHRVRTTMTAAPNLLAMRHTPSKIEPIDGVPDVFDFPRDIQPVLDSLCVKCHGYEKTAEGGPRAGRLILSGDHGPMFSHGYYMMTIAGLFSDGRNQPKSNYAPRTLGSSASRILTMLDGSHYGVKATAAQKKTLRLWIESAAVYPGTYAALGSGMIGGYAQNAMTNTDGEWPTTKIGGQVITQRCAGCHHEPARLLPLTLSDERGVSFWQPQIGDPRLNTSRHIVFNLSRPEKSMLLLAPLAESSGGWGLCRDPKTKERVTVFANTNDPDYQKLLAMCVAGKENLDTIKRFDMPAFRPRIEWVREMKRYGVLAESLDPAVPLDVYAVERAYWKSLWYTPPRQQLTGR